jgi:hypothetical protein
MAYIDGHPTVSPAFAAQLAGALVWKGDWPASEAVLRRAPTRIRDAAMTLRPWIDAMTGMVDKRRQVLVVAEHLVVVLRNL